MASIEKIKEKIRKLIYNQNGRTEQEKARCNEIAESLMKKYNLTLKDLHITSELKDEEIKKRVYRPKIEEKTNPKWLEVMICLICEQYKVRPVLATNRLGCTLFGEDTGKVIERLDYGIERSSLTFKTLSAFIKKLRKADYLLGFAFGYSEAIAKEILDQQSKDGLNPNLGQIEGSTEALVVISRQLTETNKAIAELKQAGKANEGEVKIDIKDQKSFDHGYRDGKLALSKLMKGKVA